MSRSVTPLFARSPTTPPQHEQIVDLFLGNSAAADAVDALQAMHAARTVGVELVERSEILLDHMMHKTRNLVVLKKAQEQLLDERWRAPSQELHELFAQLAGDHKSVARWRTIAHELLWEIKPAVA